MKLYYRPGSCALACHIVVEELQIPCEVEAVPDEVLYSDEFHEINPRNQVPSLVTDEGLITESVAIMVHFANKYGGIGRITPPPESWEYARMMMQLLFMASQEHPAFGMYLRPFRFHDDEAVQADLTAKGRENWHKAMTRTNEWLEGRDWLAGDAMSLADCLAFVHARWGLRVEPTTIEAYPNVWALAERMAEVPSVQRTLAAQGITLTANG